MLLLTLDDSFGVVVTLGDLMAIVVLLLMAVAYVVHWVSETVKRRSAPASYWHLEKACYRSAPVPSVCREKNCLLCQGMACQKCGAGCWNNDPHRPTCNHDVLERHDAPEIRDSRIYDICD